MVSINNSWSLVDYYWCLPTNNCVCQPANYWFPPDNGYCVDLEFRLSLVYFFCVVVRFSNADENFRNLT